MRTFLCSFGTISDNKPLRQVGEGAGGYQYQEVVRYAEGLALRAGVFRNAGHDGVCKKTLDG